MDFIKVNCATCQHPVLAATTPQGAVDLTTLECMLCKPARYPFAPDASSLYVSHVEDAPEFCSECRALESDEMRGRPDHRLYLEGMIEDTDVPLDIRATMVDTSPGFLSTHFPTKMKTFLN
jgi:hypothetical protein